MLLIYLLCRFLFEGKRYSRLRTAPETLRRRADLSLLQLEREIQLAADAGDINKTLALVELRDATEAVASAVDALKASSTRSRVVSVCWKEIQSAEVSWPEATYFDAKHSERNRLMSAFHEQFP